MGPKNELKISLDELIASAERSAIAAISRSLEDSARSHIYELFKDGIVMGADGKRLFRRAPLNEIIRRKIDDYALSDAFEVRMQAKIEEHLDNACDEALIKMLKSAARKRIFTAVPFKPEDA